MAQERTKIAIGALAGFLIAWAEWYLARPAPKVPGDTAPVSAQASRIAATPASGAVPRRPPRTAAEAQAQGKTPETSPLLRAAPERPALAPVPPAAGATEPLPETRQLLAPGRTGRQDLKVVYGLLAHYRSLFGGFPTGEDNAAVVNALTGNNPQRVALLERGNPALSAQGELVDRWGTPLFFHQESRDAVEVRSAGPDKEMYTPDDLLERTASLEAGGEAPP